jgi:hypothetical protein
MNFDQTIVIESRGQMSSIPASFFEALGSDLCLDIAIHYLKDIFVVSLSLCNQLTGWYMKLVSDRFLSHHVPFIIHWSSNY